jgi:hypothetical protein
MLLPRISCSRQTNQWGGGGARHRQRSGAKKRTTSKLDCAIYKADTDAGLGFDMQVLRSSPSISHGRLGVPRAACRVPRDETLTCMFHVSTYDFTEFETS